MWNKKNLSMMFCQLSFGLSFYGVMIVLSPFLLKDLAYPEAKTMMILGAFSSIGTLFAIAGGIIGDKYLGAYRSLTAGYVGFTAGYTFLIYCAIKLDGNLLVPAIALVCYGRGLMSPNYPTLFKTTFNSQNDFEKGYPINYSINNVGALVGQYVFPFLTAYIAYKGNFAIAAGFTGASVLLLIMMHKPLVANATEIDRGRVAPKSWALFFVFSIVMIATAYFIFLDLEKGQYIVYTISAAAVGYFIFFLLKSSTAIKLRLVTVLVMLFMAIAFFVYYGQMYTSMNIIAINTMRGDLFGFIKMMPESTPVMNSFWCVIAGPVIAIVFGQLEKRKINLTTATKVGWAFVCTSIAFAFLAFCLKNVSEDMTMRPEVFLIVHGFQAFGEVIIGSLVVAYILRVVPKEISGFSVSLFMVAMACSGVLGAAVSKAVALKPGETLTQELINNRYGNFYISLTIAALVFMVLCFLSSIMITRMLKKADEIEAKTPTATTSKSAADAAEAEPAEKSSDDSSNS
ncbi:peptide MFS transporter [Dichelobacter nodosus]|uniref:Conserved hypothetical membrane protein n=1 Tax=Dichelobacter nodosus (strain VCS1703A) TaxID=246195 RepID=A5EWN9_DICNV|nr:MFS transporter [Dichelobacter nodosus]ABQ13796.1 conserved hypothetical membrane protein [Dichelobacter nodosus VCS1703A]